MRKIVFILFVLNFLFVLLSSMSMPKQIQRLPREAYQMIGLTVAYSGAMAFALVVLAYWVWRDGEAIESLYEQLDRLRRA